MSSREKPSPPRTRLIVNVGVTGHRNLELTQAEEQALRGVVKTRLEQVARTGEQANQEGGWFTGEPTLLRIVSALAEGADCLVAELALDLGYRLHAPLPFARLEYEKDFGSPGARNSFNKLCDAAERILQLDGPGSASSRARGYELVSEVVLQQADLLLAVCERDRERKRGGSTDVMWHAARQQLPILRVDPRPPFNVEGLQLDLAGEWVPCDPSAVFGQLKRRLLPRAHPDDREVRVPYFEEKSPQRTWGFVGSRKKPASLELQQVYGPQPPLKSGWTKQLECVLDHFVWAESLAAHYARLHRSGQLAIAALGATAVTLAMLAGIYDSLHLLFGLELFLLGAIVVLMVGGWTGRWEKRWADYRLLAEGMRHLLFAAPLGRLPPLFRHEAHSPSPVGWVDWHLRSIARSVGLLGLAIDPPHLQICRELIGHGLLASQQEYQEGIEARSRALSKLCHGLSGLMFIGGASICALHLLEPDGPRWLTVAAGALPAWGAAAAAIHSQRDFHGMAERAEALSRALGERRKLMPAPQAVSSTALSELVLPTAEMLAAEILDWRAFQRERPLEFPA